jgi:hypothetical protein
MSARPESTCPPIRTSLANSPESFMSAVIWVGRWSAIGDLHIAGSRLATTQVRQRLLVASQAINPRGSPHNVSGTGEWWISANRVS